MEENIADWQVGYIYKNEKQENISCIKLRDIFNYLFLTNFVNYL